MPGGVFSTAKLHAMTIRESANDGSDFTNPDADYRRLFLGEDGALHLKDSAGAVTDIGGSSGITVEDEGSSEGTGLTTLNFTGAGVSVTVAGAEAEVIIPGGGGGFTPSYVGKNAVGASTEAIVGDTWYTKLITVASDGLLAEVQAYLGDNGSFQVASNPIWALWTSTSSQPHRLITTTSIATAEANNYLLSDGAGVADDFRWVGTGGLTTYLAAGTYFVGLRVADAGNMFIAYDTSGSDLTAPYPGWISDLRNYQTITNSTKDYSIRARILT